MLSARIAEVGALRYTPAQLPALDMWLEHESQIDEAGRPRQVKARLKAVAFGSVAERLGRQTVGGDWRFTGFLASPNRGSGSVLLHIQDFSAMPDALPEKPSVEIDR